MPSKPNATTAMASGRNFHHEAPLYDDQTLVTIPGIPDALLRSATLNTCPNNPVELTLTFITKHLPQDWFKTMPHISHNDRLVTTHDDLAPHGWTVATITLPVQNFTIRAITSKKT